jgi:hypothetical protein
VCVRVCVCACVCVCVYVCVLLIYFVSVIILLISIAVEEGYDLRYNEDVLEDPDMEYGMVISISFSLSNSKFVCYCIDCPKTFNKISFSCWINGYEGNVDMDNSFTCCLIFAYLTQPGV